MKNRVADTSDTTSALAPKGIIFMFFGGSLGVL